MPVAGSLLVKKADTTTDITYDLLAGAPGDGTPAVWRQDTGAAAGLPVGMRPWFKVASKWNGPKTARQVTFEYVYPYAVQDSTTTLYAAKDRCVLTGIATTPQSIPAAVLNEFAAQGLGLCFKAVIVQSVAQGYAPT